VKVNVWAAIHWSYRSTLWVSTEHVTGSVYAAILQDHLTPLLPWGRKKLVQDRATFHQSQEVRHRLAELKVQLAELKVQQLDDFLSCSPDLNIIEHLWSWMKHTVASSHPTNRIELIAAIHAAWNNLPKTTIQNFVSHVSHVMRQVISAEGWHAD
jgi:transposase